VIVEGLVRTGERYPIQNIGVSKFQEQKTMLRTTHNFEIGIKSGL
jgi:hypothetical protein